MAPQSANARAELRPALKRARAQIRLALVQGQTELGASQNALARWTKKHPQTIGAWLREERAVDVEAVLASPKLSEPFRRALCSAQHTHHSASYIAKPNSARRKSARKGAR